MDYYRVIFQPSFLEDLESIVRVIAAKDAGAAGRLGELLVRTGESLAFFPERHPCVRQRRELRRCIVAQHYKVFYRVKASERVVEILRCWDGRRSADPAFE